MAKFTLLFKHKIIAVFHLEEKRSTIGRDSENTFSIDSLALAPTQLKVTFENQQFYIENVSEQHPAFLNGKHFNKSPIHHGDTVNLSKHELLFSEESAQLFNTASSNDSPEKEETISHPAFKGDANSNLQIMSGPKIGRIIELKNALTKVYDDDLVPAIIAKRHSGYYISRLLDDVEILIEGESITAETLLTDNTKLKIGQTKFIFFDD